MQPITVSSVVKNGGNSVYCDGVVAVDVWLGDTRVVEGEVGGRAVGDEDRLVR